MNIYTVASYTFNTNLSIDRIKNRLRTHYNLKDSFSPWDIFKTNPSDYSGSIKSNSFKIVGNNPKDPHHFFFTRIIGQINQTNEGTTISIKAQFNDMLIYGSPFALLFYVFLGIQGGWELTIFPTFIILVIFFYGKNRIQKDFDDFKGKFHFYTTKE